MIRSHPDPQSPALQMGSGSTAGAVTGVSVSSELVTRAACAERRERRKPTCPRNPPVTQIRTRPRPSDPPGQEQTPRPPWGRHRRPGLRWDPSALPAPETAETDPALTERQVCTLFLTCHLSFPGNRSLKRDFR